MGRRRAGRDRCASSTNGSAPPWPSKRPPRADFWIAPIETVSESEDGFERIYQGSQIVAVWPVELSVRSRMERPIGFQGAPAIKRLKTFHRVARKAYTDSNIAKEQMDSTRKRRKS